MAPPTESKNTVKNAVDVIIQDINHIEKTQTNLASQITRIQRMMKLDEKEVATQRQRSETMLLQAVENNTMLVTALLERMLGTEDDPLGMSYYHERKRQEQRESQKRLDTIRSLSQLRQKKTGTCPCGQHKGIQFLDESDNVVEERCPKSWWISLSRLALEEGRLGTFTKTTPIDKYLSRYSLTK